MKNEEQNKPLPPSLWQRIKNIFTVEDRDTASTTVPPKLAYRVRYLERCLLKDVLSERIRKQLERQWEQSPSVEP